MASWRAAYRGLLADEVLDGLSTAEREERRRGLIDDGESGFVGEITAPQVRPWQRVQWQ